MNHFSGSIFLLNWVPEYFQRAMKHFRDKWENVTFLVFSDNLLWCARQSLFDADDVHVMKGQCTVTQDLAMMSACNGVILSVGTFGWWAGHFRVEIQIMITFESQLLTKRNQVSAMVRIQQ